MRQAWSSFSMAPRQKYGQDRGHVTRSGPMSGQHCRGRGPITGPELPGRGSLDKLLLRAALQSRAIHEFLNRPARPAGAACKSRPATGLEPGQGRLAGRVGPGSLVLHGTRPGSVSSPPQPRSQSRSEISKLRYRSSELSVQLSLFSDTQRGQLSEFIQLTTQ